jgi:outer membrane protein TolC
MHELIAFLLGATVISGAIYIWWTARRFRQLRTILLEALNRAQELERDTINLNARSRNHSTRLATLTTQLRRVGERRPVDLNAGVPDGDPDTERESTGLASQQPPTVWDRLKNDVDKL